MVFIDAISTTIDIHFPKIEMLEKEKISIQSPIKCLIRYLTNKNSFWKLTCEKMIFNFRSGATTDCKI